jgi:hypothetical protein
MKYVANGFVFVIIYILFMIPTYALPYLGSNSAVFNTAGQASGAGFHPLLMIHLVSLLILVAITWLRGSFISKNWIVIFPLIALLFDLTPFLSWVPLVPTAMHICSIIIGVANAPVTVKTA